MFESSGTNNQEFFFAQLSSATKFSSASSEFAVHRAISPDEISRLLSKQPETIYGISSLMQSIIKNFSPCISTVYFTADIFPVFSE